MNESEWSLNTWVMSCRVFGRGVEEAVFEEVLKAAAVCRVNTIVSEYLVGPRNSIVSSLFDKLGFEKTNEGVGNSIWSYDVKREFNPSHHICVENKEFLNSVVVNG